MTRRIGKLMSQAAQAIWDLLVGVFIGSLLVAFVIGQHPAISEILKYEGGDREVQFVVVCTTSTNGRVKCLLDEELIDVD